MSFNCSSLTEKQIEIIKYVQNYEQNVYYVLATILILNGFIMDVKERHTPLYIGFRSLRRSMQSRNSLCLYAALAMGLIITRYIPVINTFVFITLFLFNLRWNRRS